MRLSKRELLLLLCLLIIIGTIYSFWHFLYQPVKVETATLIIQNNSMKAEIHKTENNQNSGLNVIAEQRKVIEDYTRVMEKVSQDPQVPEIINFLEKTARDTGVKLTAIKYGDKEDKASGKTNPTVANLRTADFQITARGSYYNILSFILKIENAPRIYIITNSKIIVPECENDDGSKTGTYDKNNTTADLNFSAYYNDRTIPGLDKLKNELEKAGEKSEPNSLQDLLKY